MAYRRFNRFKRSSAASTSAAVPDDIKLVHISTYDSPRELIERGQENDGDAEWFGGTPAQIRNWALHGDASMVPAIEAHLNAIDAHLPDTWTRQTRADVYGPRLNVSDWIAERPTPFRRRVRAAVEAAPVRIFVSLTSSAGIDAETMAKRAATICALIELVQQARPVELYAFNELGSYTYSAIFQTVRIGTAPLGLAALAGGIGHVGFARCYGYGTAARDADFDGGWPTLYYEHKATAYAEQRAAALGLGPNDVLIGAAESWDPLIEKPLQWIESQLARITMEATA